MLQWPRLWTAMITPLDTAGGVNLPVAGRLANWLTDHGSGGLVVAGSTGEAATLSESERRALLQAVRSAVGPKIPLLMGTGTNDTNATIRLSRQAVSDGADGVMVVAPYYNKPPQEGLVQHFLAVADAVAVPIMLYNVPGRTGVNVSPATVVRIMREAPHVLAVKEAGGSLEVMTRLVRDVPAGRLVYSGDDSLTLPALAVGAYGVVSVAAHVVGDHIARMIAAYQEGRIEEAGALHRRLSAVFFGLFCRSNPIPVKWSLNWLGAPVGSVRLPLVGARDSDEDMQWLAAALKEAGALSINWTATGP